MLINTHKHFHKSHHITSHKYVENRIHIDNIIDIIFDNREFPTACGNQATMLSATSDMIQCVFSDQCQWQWQCMVCIDLNYLYRLQLRTHGPD